MYEVAGICFPVCCPHNLIVLIKIIFNDYLPSSVTLNHNRKLYLQCRTALTFMFVSQQKYSLQTDISHQHIIFMDE